MARELSTPLEPAVASWGKGLALASLGELDQARATLSNSLDLWKMINRAWYAFMLSWAAATTLWAGDATSAGTMLDEALDEAK